MHYPLTNRFSSRIWHRRHVEFSTCYVFFREYYARCV